MFERKPLRLKTWDYSSLGMYYITICTKDREYVFGDIMNGEMVLSKFGAIVEKCWKEIPIHFQHARIDEFVIMPNHIHGIVKIIRRDGIYAIRQYENVMGMRGLSEIVRWFKGRSTFECNQQLQDGINAIPTQGSIWQSRFYDHVIRNDKDLHRIREYIQDNPAKWEQDKYR